MSHSCSVVMTVRVYNVLHAAIGVCARTSRSELYHFKSDLQMATSSAVFVA